MASNTYSPLTVAPYQTDMEVWLKQLEGNTPAQQTPQVDTVGHPTVGVGIDLTVPANLIDYLRIIGQTGNQALTKLLSTVYVSDANSTAAQKYQTAVANYTAENGGIAIPTLSTDQVEALYQQVETDHYNTFVTLITKPAYNIDVTDLLKSNEGLAVFSLAYNSGTPGTHLLADLNQDNFNRVDAWFQIRYLSNGGNSQSLGLAKRRYEESQVFGLYDPADSTGGTVTASLTEATAIYAEFSLNGDTLTGGEDYRDFAFDYENLYGTNGIAKANGDLSSSSLSGSDLAQFQVGTLEAELQPAANALIQNYVLDPTLNPYLTSGTFSTGSISSLDVQVAAAQGGSYLDASYRDGYNLAPSDTDKNAQDYNSLLIAQGGNDTLDASMSSANDVLIGGTGSDTILGGTGYDYIVAGTGNDLITLIGGNDTVVLGDANNPLDGKHDIVDASHDAGNVTYVVGAGTQETIKLGSGNSIIELVSNQPGTGVSLKTLAITAYWIGPGEWYDATDNALLIQQPDSSTGLVDPNASSKNIEIIYGSPASGSGSADNSRRLSLAQLQQVANDPNAAQTVIELTLDGFTGSTDDGVTLGAPPPAPTPPGSSNLSQLHDEGLSGDTTPGGDAKEVYEDSIAGALVGSIYGADSSANAFGNEILGDGNASFISAGNGNNTVLLGNFYQHATDPTAAVLNATVQGGSGNQTLIGVGNGTETITGGAVGTNTSATTFIDGGGATADLVGGGQNSVIFGGTGADTLEASESNGSSGSGFNPTSILMAGLSFWGDAYSSVTGASGDEYDVGSLPEVNWSGSPANVQVDLSLFQTDDTYGTPFNLLGSSYDSGSPGSTTLPGSLLIGGTGHDVLIGNSGNDTIIGGNPTDTVSGTTDEVLIGGAGANLIYGGNGSEIIYADMGPGDVSGWATLDASDSDTVYGGDGADVIYGSGGNDYLYGGSGIDQIYVGNGSSYVDAGSGTSSVYGGTGDDTIIAGGTSDYVEMGDGNSSVSLSAGEATISTGAGNDTIAADSGGGTALITEGTGAVTIMAGVSTGSDTVQLGSGGTTVQLDSELDESTLVVRDVNGDLVLSDGGAMQLTLQSYFANGGNVALQFSDGTSWGAAQILQASMTPSSDGGDDTLVGSNGNDSITAGYGNTSIVGVSGDNTLTGGYAADTIDGGSGADTIEGGAVTTQIFGGTGLETYVYNVGDGSDTIWENTTTAGSDTLSFGTGISASDLSFVYDSSTDLLQISIASTGETILVSNFVATQPDQHQISTLAFADGTTMSQLQVFQQAWAIDGTTGNDSLTGTSSANYFDGMGGNDIEVGEGGDDTFVFNSGYGRLEINESYTSGQQPVLQLGTGITASALQVTTNGTNLVLTDGVSGDQITLDGMWSASGDGVAVVQFADGTSLTAAQLIQREMAGTIGNDTIYGTSGADLIDGKGGNDSVNGEGGSDTFVFDAGYGHLEINESYTNGQQPVLQLGAGITASALQVTGSGAGNLTLTDGVSGDQITLDGMALTSSDGVAVVQFADGTSLTASQLIQMAMTGTTGSDTIYGTSGADLIDGKGGGDSVIGNGGSDTFVYNEGYGELVINESYSSGQQPLLELGPGITASTLLVSSDSYNGHDDLVLTDGTSGDQIYLLNEETTPDTGVAEVQLADGTTYTAAQLIQMSHEIDGTTGNDTLEGTTGADLIDGRGGNDTVYGDGGSDTFVFAPGYGNLTISEVYSSGQQPVLQLGAGITAAMLHATTNGEDILLTDGTTGDEIDLQRMWTDSGSGIAAVQLADGTTITRSLLAQMAAVTQGTTGDDTLYGTSNAELFDGKGGNDSINGGGGNDTFVFDAGYGHLNINENNDLNGNLEAAGTFPSGAQPVLQLGAGITLSTLQVTMANNIVLTDGISGDQITLDGEGIYGDYGVAEVQFADGTTLTSAQLIQMGHQITGTTGNDSLIGSSGADYFDGKGGNDYERGYGDDTFVFNAGYGQLEINETDSNGSGDPSVLKLGPGITAASLHVTATFKGADGLNRTDLTLTDGISGDQITLDNMWTVDAGGSTGEYVGESYANGIEEVQFADGTTLTEAQLFEMEMTGTTGNDTLYGTSGADLLDGKGGNDVEIGNGGSDTFVFNAGYGQLTIEETGAPSSIVAPAQPLQAVLQLGAGITASALHVTTNGRDLILADSISGDQVDLYSMFSSSAWGVTTVQFADGTTLTATQLIQMEMTGTTGNDTIYGTSGADLIDGKGGNDSVNGEGGSDTIVFDAGYGHLEINESYTSGQQPVLQLGAGITASALRVTTDGANLMLTDGVSGDQVTLDGMWSSNNDGMAVVQLADGTSLTRSQLIQMEITGGTTGDDSLYGTSAADLIDGKGGDDFEDGEGGSDTFVFKAGYGELTINNLYSSGDQPVLQLSGGITASDLKVMANGTMLVITDGVPGDQINLLNDVSVGAEDVNGYAGPAIISHQSQEGVTEIQLDNGTILTADQLAQMAGNTIYGTPGSDTLGASYSTPYGDYIDGKGGSDMEYTSGGNDTFVFNPGYGELTISGAGARDWPAYTDPTPVLKLGAGITASDLRATADSNGLYLTDGVAGDKITLWGMGGRFNGTGSPVVQLADGTTLTMAQLLWASSPSATTGSDSIVGTWGAELIDGKGGNDTVQGGGGSDTFVYDVGYGALEINESYASGQSPVLQLGSGISASNLHVTTNGSDLYLTDGITGDQITLDGMWASGTSGVSAVELSDGTSLTPTQLIQMELANGTTGNDTLYGTSGADLLDGKGGDDVEYGEGGNDTFVFNSGYGQLEINENYSSGAQSVLQLGSGITTSTLHVSTDGSSLFLMDGISGDQITLDNMVGSDSYGVAAVQFSDGSTLTRAQLLQMVMTGTTGNDHLYGSPNADLLDGKGGDDVVQGNGGSDTFVFDAGYGQLEIEEAYSNGDQPVLQLGQGITASDLHVTTDGDLPGQANSDAVYIMDGISGDLITIDGMWDSDSNGVALVKLADGTTLTQAQLQQMAMTGTSGNDTLFGTPNGDLLDGKGGDDVVVGEGGSDTFVFNVGYGQLDINESYTSGQTPVLQLGAGITASNLKVTANASGSGLVLTDGTSGDQITLENAVFDDSTYGVQEVQFADGTTLTEAQLIQRETSLPGNGGSITGGSGNDTLVADTANESLIGGTGNEVFDFNTGFGQDTLMANGTASSNTILFGSGIAVSDLTFETDGSKLVIEVANSNGADGQASSITLPGHFVSGNPVTDVGELLFDDGSSLTMDQINQLFASSTPPPPPPTTVLTAGSDNTLVSDNGDDLLQANAGNDTLTGGSGTDTLESGVGNTLMNGGTGTETYLFNSGFGQDTVVADGSATSNTILFGAGITVSDLSFSTDGSELDITDTNSNGADGQASSITLPDHFVNGSPVTDVGELLFNDGSYVTMDQINQLFASAPAPAPAPTTVLTAGSNNTLASDNGDDLLQANAGNDTLSGGSGTDILESGVGNTLMNGGAGAETYLFNTGFGQDTVAANGNATSNTIQFGAGITVSDLSFSTDSSELLITATNSDGSDGQASSITLPDHFVNGSPVTDVGELVFSDGSYVTMAQINQLFAAPAAAPATSASSTSAMAPIDRLSTTSHADTATTHTATAVSSSSPSASSGTLGEGSEAHQWSVPENALTLQVNPLIHAMASFTGGGLGGGTAFPVTHTADDGLMLHVAA